MAASSLAKQVHELRRLIEARLGQNQAPVYLREGEPAPEGRQAVVIKRIFIDPSPQDEEQLPEAKEPSPAIERPAPRDFNRPLPVVTGIV